MKRPKVCIDSIATKGYLGIIPTALTPRRPRKTINCALITPGQRHIMASDSFMTIYCGFRRSRALGDTSLRRTFTFCPPSASFPQF